MRWFKELFKLVGMLFHRVRTDGVLDHTVMRHFPFKGYKYMMWCDNLVTRIEKLSITAEEEKHEGTHLQQAIYNFKWWWQYYLRYGREWLKVLFRSGFSLRVAYKCNPFEMEARGHEGLDGSYVGKGTWKRFRIRKPRTTYQANAKTWGQYCRKLVMEKSHETD